MLLAKTWLVLVNAVPYVVRRLKWGQQSKFPLCLQHVREYVCGVYNNTHVVQELIARVSVSTSKADSKKWSDERKQNMYVTIPGTGALILKEQLVEQVVQEVLRLL